MDAQQIVERLKRKQAECGLRRQKDLARVLDVSEPTISRVYSGQRGPSGTLLLAILRVWPDFFDDGRR